MEDERKPSSTKTVVECTKFSCHLCACLDLCFLYVNSIYCKILIVMRVGSWTGV
jgi:hypothetical protein